MRQSYFFIPSLKVKKQLVLACFLFLRNLVPTHKYGYSSSTFLEPYSSDGNMSNSASSTIYLVSRGLEVRIKRATVRSPAACCYCWTRSAAGLTMRRMSAFRESPKLSLGNTLSLWFRIGSRRLLFILIG